MAGLVGQGRARWGGEVAGRMGPGGGPFGALCWDGWVGGWAGMGLLQRMFIQPKRVYVTAE